MGEPRNIARIRHSLVLVFGGSLAALFLIACRPEPRADFVLINGAEPATLDPQKALGQPDGRITGELFEGLVRRNAKSAEPEPGLAESWTVSPDGRTYTFALRPGATWSDGTPIRASDFVDSWLRVLQPTTGAPYANLLFCIENAENILTGKIQDLAQFGARALSDSKLEVRLIQPTPYFLDLCAFRTLAPVPMFYVRQRGENWIRGESLPVSGPYQLKAWRVNDRVRLAKNPRYWDVDAVSLNRIDILPTESPHSALNLFMTGAADYIADARSIPSELTGRLQSRPEFHSYSYLATYFLRFNTTKPPLNDARVRRAIILAVNRQEVIGRILRLGEKPASHLTPNGIPGYVPPEGLSFDPAEARRLLVDAGYGPGRPFPALFYMYNAGGGGGAGLHEKLGVELQNQLLHNAGIRLEMRPVEWKTFLSDQRALNYDLSRGSWVADFASPHTFLDIFTSNNGNNRTGWTNALYDQHIRNAGAEPDLQRRYELLRQAESLLVRDEAPIFPLYFYRGLVAYDPGKIDGLYANALDAHPLRSVRKKGQP